MIFVDSSVWIDYFRGTAAAEADRLDTLLGESELVTGDIVVTEVLQGFDRDSDFETARRRLTGFPVVTIGGPEIAIQAAQHFRTLHGLGITVRKTIDPLIATRCIAEGWPLLFSDRDFDPFVAHLGLASAMA